MWWHTSVTPALWETEEEGLWPEADLKQNVRPYLKNKLKHCITGTALILRSSKLQHQIVQKRKEITGEMRWVYRTKLYYRFWLHMKINEFFFI
jgi:hypothetical protein